MRRLHARCGIIVAPHLLTPCLLTPCLLTPYMPDRMNAAFTRLVLLGTMLMLMVAVLVPLPAVAEDADAWPVIGRQGIVRIIIVPLAQARSRDAYAAQIERLCEPQQSCFINFFTNSRGATPALPLPEAIEQEPTAIYRRSMKQAGEFFRWSCRLELDAENCF